VTIKRLSTRNIEGGRSPRPLLAAEAAKIHPPPGTEELIFAPLLRDNRTVIAALEAKCKPCLRHYLLVLVAFSSPKPFINSRSVGFIDAFPPVPPDTAKSQTNL